MFLESKIKAFKRKMTSIGLFGTLRLIVVHAMNRICHREHLLFYVDVQKYSMCPDQLSNEVVARHVKCIEDLTEKDIRMIRDYAGEKYVQELGTRLANNWSLFLGYIGDEVVGGGWVIDHNAEFKTKGVPLFENDIMLIDYFTFHSYRGRNVYPFLLSFIITYFRQKNVIRAFIDVHESNVASIKGIKKAAFTHFINYETYSFRGNEVVLWKGAFRRKRHT